MTLQDAIRCLDDFLVAIAAALAFRRTTPLEYERPMNEGIAMLSWPCRVDSRGVASFTCAVGVRFPGLGKWLNSDPNKLAATVGAPIHFLREDRRFTEWNFASPLELEALRSTILSDLEKIAIPFAEDFSIVANLRRAVASSDPNSWRNLGVDRDSRIGVLAAIQIEEGDKQGALKTLEDALSERKGELPKRWLRLEQLRDRIEKAA